MKRITKRLPLLLTLVIALLTGFVISNPVHASPAAHPGADLTPTEIAGLLSATNDWRQRYSVPPVTWDTTVAAVAQDWANQMAATDNFSHRPNNKYGENIWAGTTGFFVPADVVNGWGGEVANYDFATNTCAVGKVCGHFTQLVWANTTRIGCGKATANNTDYYVCNYDPPGNFVGEAPGAKPAAGAQPTTATTTNIEPTGTPVTALQPTATTAAVIQPTATTTTGAQAAITATATAAPILGTSGLNATDAAAFLAAHNDMRQRYGVPPVAWNNSIADAAQVWATQFANGIETRPAGNPYGESEWSATEGIFTPAAVVAGWGNQVNDYNFATNTCATGKFCNQFTQIVWAKTTEIGCAKATAGGHDFFICNYNPPGNVGGQAPGAVPAAVAALTPTTTAQAENSPTLGPTSTITPTTTASTEITATITATATTTIQPTETPAAGTPSATTTLTATQSITGTSGLSTGEISALLAATNTWRQRYSVPAVAWDETVAAVAQDWADHLAATNDFSHRPDNKYGENIWSGSTGFFAPDDVVSSWGSEVANYDFATNTCAADKTCGHFTQLVWANTTKIGCGKATGNGNDYYVCNYDPPGNFVGQTPGASPAAAPTATPAVLVPTATTSADTLQPTVTPETPADTTQPTATPDTGTQPTDIPANTPQPTDVPADATAPSNTQPDSAVDVSSAGPTIPGNTQLWFTVPYAGNNADLTLRIPKGDENGLAFQVFSPSQMTEWWHATPVGAGSGKDGDLLWTGGSMEVGPYFILVINPNAAPIGYSIATQ